MKTEQNRKTVTVALRVEVECDVDVGPPNEDGQAEIYGIRLASRGNFGPVSFIDPGALSEAEYDEIDREAAKAFEEE